MTTPWIDSAHSAARAKIKRHDDTAQVLQASIASLMTNAVTARHGETLRARAGSAMPNEDRPMNPCHMNARAMALAIANGTLSARHCVSAALGTIADDDDRINAFTAVQADDALATADATDAARAR